MKRLLGLKIFKVRNSRIPNLGQGVRTYGIHDDCIYRLPLQIFEHQLLTMVTLYRKCLIHTLLKGLKYIIAVSKY